MFGKYQLIQSNLPDGSYCNSEYSNIESKLFLHISGDGVKVQRGFRGMGAEPISNRAYYAASRFPNLSKSVLDGTCFVGWILPNPSTIIDICSSTVELRPKRRIWDANTYITKSIQTARFNIQELYNKHNEVVFLYSGGIDSIVVFWLIEELGLLSKTHIVYYKSLLTDQRDANAHETDFSFLCPEKSKAIDRFFKYVDRRCASAAKVTYDRSDVLGVFQNSEFPEILHYSETCMANRFTPMPVLTGNHGNITLMHGEIVIFDKLVSSGSSMIANSRPVYCSSLARGGKVVRPIHDMTCSYNIYKSTMQKRVYTPFPQFTYDVDLTDIDLVDLLDITILRRLLPTHLQPFIVSESLYERSETLPFMIPTVEFDLSKFWIPDNLNHDLYGAAELTKRLTRPRVSLLDLMAVKQLQYISSLI